MVAGLSNTEKGTEIDTLFKITTYLKLSEKLEFIFKSESKSLPSQSPQACTGDGGGGEGKMGEEVLGDAQGK